MKIILCLALSVFFSSLSAANAVDSLAPGCWLKVQSSQLRSVAPTGWSANVMAPWCGGAFDTKRNRLIVWGGGHGDYSGNEIYVFSLDSLKWTRLTNPSNPPARDVPYAADGGPCSRHTYDYIQYLPAIDRFATFGGAGFWQSGQTGTAHTDVFDFDSLKWSALADVPARAFGIGAFSGVDPVTGHAWQHGAGGKMLILAEFDPDSNRWTAHGGAWTEGNNDFNYYLTGAIDPKRRLFVACGGNYVWTWRIDTTGNIVGKRIQTTGDTAMVRAASPGFEYAASIDRFVAWSGGTDVFILNMENKVWTRIQPSASNTAVPTAACVNGTFGRFRYCPAKGVFVTVNSITEDVYIYRLPDTLRENTGREIRPVPSFNNNSGMSHANGTVRFYDVTGRYAGCRESDLKTGVYVQRQDAERGSAIRKIAIIR